MTDNDTMNSTQPAVESATAGSAAAAAEMAPVQVPTVEAVAETAPLTEPFPSGEVLIAKEPKAVKIKTHKAIKAPKAAKAPKLTKAAPASSLAAAIADKIAKQGYSASEAADRIGVNPLSLRAILSGKSTPNARTVARYTTWLGDSAPKPAPAAVVTKVKAANKAVKPARRGRKPATVVASAPVGSLKAAFAQIRAALSAGPVATVSDGMQGDKLAVAVHKAPEATRRIIKALLKAI